MAKGILASQISFSKGASSLEYLFNYGEITVGVVIRKGAGKNVRWEVEDHPECFGTTREEAVIKLLSSDLSVAMKPPVRSHRWVSADKGSPSLRYICNMTGSVHDHVTSSDTMTQLCLDCGEPVSFNPTYNNQVVFAMLEGEWVLTTR